MRIVLLYVAGAILATIANIGTQELSIRLVGGSYQVIFSVIAGTGAGLVLKYLWDKRFIFGVTARSAAHDAKMFSGYAAFGLATTALFWLFEFGFDLLFGTKEMRYAGAVLGLAIGYTAKYFLDKAFVFRT